MASINKVILVGNLGRDPEVRATASGGTIASLNLATTEKFKGRNGEAKEQTEWHRVVIFGKQAETAERYLRKGSPVYIEGRLQTKKWQDQNGRDRYTTEIVCERVLMLGGSKSAEPEIPPARTSQDDDFDVPFDPLDMKSAVHAVDDYPF